MSAPGYPEYLGILAIRTADTPANAVSEDRCIERPIGCGQPLIGEDGTARVFWDQAEAAEYEAEWRTTGLCPDCQDAADTESVL